MLWTKTNKQVLKLKSFQLRQFSEKKNSKLPINEIINIMVNIDNLIFKIIFVYT